LHPTLSNLHFKNGPALIVDAGLGFRLQSRHTCRLSVRFFRVSAGQEMFQLLLVGSAIFWVKRPLRAPPTTKTMALRAGSKWPAPVPT